MQLLTYKSYSIFHFIMFPLLNWVLPLFSTKAKERILFEKKNFDAIESKSFHTASLKAHTCYEVSSEGELEQLRPLIISDLERSRLVEIVFCSDSVEAQCLSLFKKYPNQLRIFRLPILSFKSWGKKKHCLWEWVTAESLFLCRYDFFPELMILGRQRMKFFALISASLKGKDLSKMGLIENKVYNYIYKSFDFFTTPTSRDKSLLQIHFNLPQDKIQVVDLRVLQIMERLKTAQETMSCKIPGQEYLLPFLEDNIAKTIVFGSFWPIEVDLMNEGFFQSIKKSELTPVIVPHQLSSENIGRIKLNLKAACGDLCIYQINQDDTASEVQSVINALKDKNGILLFNVKGVLCEFYSMFKLAYVGGGHGRSVHSLLEPYLANCNLLCGPKTFRSTEYDIIIERSVEHIKNILEARDLLPSISEMLSKSVDISKRGQYISDTVIVGHEVSQLLEIKNDR
jgi:3-deoxy-D-manno-octulosonic-acid transferase